MIIDAESIIRIKIDRLEEMIDETDDWLDRLYAERHRLQDELDRIRPPVVFDHVGGRWSRLPDGRYLQNAGTLKRYLAEVATEWGPLTHASTGEPVTV